MKLYHLHRTQFLPITLQDAWQFFSNPKNLAQITPADLLFKILYISREGSTLYPGQLIRYKIKILPGIFTYWVTEIKHVEEPSFFVDEQRYGPYSLWHHQHHFKEVAGGVEMTDEVNYAIPFGIIGRLAHWIFVGRKVNAIFDYRSSVLEKLFVQQTTLLENTKS
jgi:ligand-binding SRPBCC domain-containing protein